MVQHHCRPDFKTHTTQEEIADLGLPAVNASPHTHKGHYNITNATAAIAFEVIAAVIIIYRYYRL
jgi:hypothetical protein